jgi:hypothetical protein
MSVRVLATLKSLNCTCKDAACLISQQDERKLSRAERVGLRLHLILCRACRRYLASVKFIKQAMRRCGESETLSTPEALPSAARDRIHQRLAGQ